MKKYSKYRFGSMTTMMVVFAILLIVIVSIENIIVTNQSWKYAKQNTIISEKASLDLVMGQIDNAIVNLNDTVAQVTIENENFLWLTRHSKKSENGSLYYKHIFSLMNDLDQQISKSTLKQGWFLYFPLSEQTVYRTYNAGINDFLHSIFESDNIEQYRGIHYLESNGVSYIWALYSKNGSWCGSWIDISKIFDPKEYSGNADVRFRISEDNPAEGWTTLNSKSAYRVVSKSSILEISIEEIRTMDMTSSMNNVRLMALFSIALIIVTIIFGIWAYKNIIKPLQKLKIAINTIEQGDFDYRIDPSNKNNDIEVLNAEFNSMLEQMQNLKLDVYEMKLNHQKAELRYLEQQVRPHFILNALNIIYSYQEKDFQQIRQMVMMLTKYFRYIINVHSDFVPLHMEFQQIQNYLEIQKVRYPRQFEYELKCDSNLKMAGIPPLIIQSFVENSIKYAISPNGQTTILVSAECEGTDYYRLTIEDNGAGYREEILANIQSVLNGENENTNGVGVRNSIDRLRIYFGNDVQISIFNKESGGACARMLLPVNLLDEEIE